MNYEELTPEHKEIWDEGQDHGYDLGYDAGWDAGYESGSSETDYSENYDSGYADGYRAGVKAEQDRIQSVLGMMFESSLNLGQGNKAIQYKHAMDLLRPISLGNVPDDDEF